MELLQFMGWCAAFLYTAVFTGILLICFVVLAGIVAKLFEDWR